MMTSRTEPAGHASHERREHFMKLLMPVYKRLEDFAVAMTRDPEEACDLVSETLLRAYENFGRLKDEKAFLSYLFTIASREHQRRRPMCAVGSSGRCCWPSACGNPINR